MRLLLAADLAAFDARSLAEVVASGELLIAAGAGEIHDLALAALLVSDYAVLDPAAVLVIDSPEAWAGAAWRLGRGAMSLLLESVRPGLVTLPAAEALERGLCDEITDRDPRAWLESWTENRSLAALETAAQLIRSRGGDRLERAEFARLFATGEPQRGLEAFLGRRGRSS
jgi:hypothetical protein